MTEPEVLLRDLITGLKRGENARLLEAMAREINNHIFIRGSFHAGGGELTSEDMQCILTRLQIVETTLQLSARGQGPEAFAPRNRERVTPLNPKVLEGLESDLRSSRGAK